MALAMRPERVVLVCVDGGRQDWFEKYATPNINRLISEGVGFRNAVVGHAFAETASGVATISTGADIRHHGIIASHEWYDPEGKGAVYSIDDRGEASHLKVQTFGDAIKSTFPGVHVASISTKDRNAILLAGHQPDLIAYCYREFPSVLNFTGPGVHTGAYQFSERKGYNLPSYLASIKTSRIVDWISNGVKHAEMDLATTPSIDEFIMTGALEVLRQSNPYLLIISLVSPNIVGHFYSFDSPELKDSIRSVDQQIGRLLDELCEHGEMVETLIVLTADHGMTEIRGTINLTQKLAGNGRNGITEDIAYMINGGTGGIYLKRPEKSSIHRVLKAVKELDHIEGAWYKEDEEAPWYVKEVNCRHAPDIIVLPEYGYFCGSEHKKMYGSHGAPYYSDSSILMVFSGPGIQKQGTLGSPLNLRSTEPILEKEVSLLPRQRDIAPTIEEVLGLPVPPGVSGRILPVLNRP